MNAYQCGYCGKQYPVISLRIECEQRHEAEQ